MPETVFTLSAESGDAVQGMLKLIEHEHKSIEAMKALKKEAHEAKGYFHDLGEGVKEVGEGITNQLLPGLAGIATAGGAIALVFETALSAIEKSTERAKEFAKIQDDIMAAAVKGSQIALAPRIEEMVKELKSPHGTVTQHELTGISTGVLGDMGQRLGTGDQALANLREATEFGAKAKELGQDAVGAGDTIAFLRSLDPSADAKTLEHFAGQLMGRGGRHTEEERKRAMQLRAMNTPLSKIVEEELVDRASLENPLARRRVQGFVEKLGEEKRPEAKLSEDQENRIRAIKAEELSLEDQERDLKAKVKFDEHGREIYSGAVPGVLGYKDQERKYHEHLKELSLKKEALSSEREHIELSKSVSQEALQQYHARQEIARLPMEEREAALAANPSLAPAKIRGDLALLNQASLQEKKTPSADVIALGQANYESMMSGGALRLKRALTSQEDQEHAKVTNEAMLNKNAEAEEEYARADEGLKNVAKFAAHAGQVNPYQAYGLGPQPQGAKPLEVKVVERPRLANTESGNEK